MYGPTTDWVLYDDIIFYNKKMIIADVIIVINQNYKYDYNSWLRIIIIITLITQQHVYYLCDTL